jgi:hypothetical protein
VLNGAEPSCTPEPKGASPNVGNAIADNERLDSEITSSSLDSRYDMMSPFIVLFDFTG